MLNLHLIENQPHWRVALVALFAQLMGVLIHVEGIPFGSNRSRKKQVSENLGGQAQGMAAVGRIGQDPDAGLPTAEEVRGILKP